MFGLAFKKSKTKRGQSVAAHCYKSLFWHRLQLRKNHANRLIRSPEVMKPLLVDWAGFKTLKAVDINKVRETGINLITDTLEQKFDFSKLQNN